MPHLETAMFKFYAPTLIASRGSDGEMRIEGVASSTVRDHHGDRITEKALRKMVKSAIGMTIFLNHEYRVQDVFGSVEKARIVKTSEVDEKTGEPIFDMRLGVVVEQRNPEAVQTWEILQPRQAADGTLKPGTKLGLSIGAMVSEGGATFDKSQGGRYVVDDLDIVETSIVTMPANPRSWIDYAVKSLAGQYPDKLTTKRLELLKEMGVDGAGEIEVAGDDAPDAAAIVDGEPQEPQTGETGAPMEAIEVAEGETATLEADGAEDAPEGEATEDAIPVEKTKVSIWDGDKTIEIDTGRSRAKDGDGDQSAQAGDEPTETAGGSTTTKDVGLDHPLIKSLTGQLAVLKERHEAETVKLTGERDAALALAASTLEQAGEILKALESKPVGRKTNGRFEDPDIEKARVDLDSLAGIYGDDVMKLLKRKD